MSFVSYIKVGTWSTACEFRRPLRTCDDC